MSGPEQQRNVVCLGGPWNGWWMTAEQLAVNQQAARRMGHDPASYPGVSLNYRPTDAVQACPTPKRAAGRVWRWSP